MSKRYRATGTRGLAVMQISDSGGGVLQWSTGGYF